MASTWAERSELTSETDVPGVAISSLTVSWIGWPLMPPDAFTLLTQAL